MGNFTFGLLRLEIGFSALTIINIENTNWWSMLWVKRGLHGANSLYDNKKALLS